MKRKLSSTSQGDFRNAKRHQNLISDEDDKVVYVSTEVAPPAPDLLIQTPYERRVSSIQATPTTTQLSHYSTRNPISSGRQSGIRQIPSPRRVGNARAYRLSFLSAASKGSQVHVERQVPSIQATPTLTQLSPCSTRNHVSDGPQSDVRRNPSARRVGNARAYQLSFLSAASTCSQVRVERQVPSIQATPTSTQLSPCSTRNHVNDGPQSNVRQNPSARRVGNAREYRLSFLSAASTGSQVHAERQVPSVQQTPKSTQLSPCSTRNLVNSASQSDVRQNPAARSVGNARTYRVSFLSSASTGSQECDERQVSSIQTTSTSAQLSPCSRTIPVISGSQSGNHQNYSARRFRLRQNSVRTSSNHSQYQNSQSQRQADSYRDMRMNIDDMSYEEFLALGEMIGKVNTGIEKTELSNFVKKVICCGEQDDEQCIICLEQYSDGDEMGLLKCSHNYHFSCISEWMKDQAICPICRCKAARF